MTREEKIEMTREEAIDILNRDDDSMRKGYFGINDFKAIEVLKSQEPVLDKIRAEIIELRHKQNVGVLECLDIIDKYKAEMESEGWQEPCADVISRQAAQAKIKNICNEYRLSYEDGERKAATGGSAYALGHAFDDLPSVTPTQRWVPVSERLPEPNIAVLTYVDTGASETFCLAYWNDACGGWEEWIGTRMIESEMEYKVLAWMPLPEPYQEEKE
jgi:hypothetical protein